MDNHETQTKGDRVSVSVPILINGDQVAQVFIVATPPYGGEDWQYRNYRWEARKGDRQFHGDVQHKPSDGLFALVASVCSEVQRLTASKTH